MGQRCNLIIIEGGVCKLYYDHWAANRLDQELFWGPEVAREFIEQRPEEPSWLDDLWCEGGCVLDFDARCLTWYGGEDVLYDPSLNLAHAVLMKSQWEGWTVEWAHEGILDFARKASVAPETVLSGKPFEPPVLDLPKTRRGGGHDFLFADAAVSYARGHTRRFCALAGAIGGMAHPELTEDSLCNLIDRFSPARFSADISNDPRWGTFQWGADLDFDRRCIKAWSCAPEPGFLDRLKAHWHGWSIDFTGPDFRWQADLLPMLPWPSVGKNAKLAIIGHLRNGLGITRAAPHTSILAALRAKFPASTIEANPSMSKGRYAPTCNPAWKHAILDALEASLE